MNARLCAELRAIRPVDRSGAVDEYAARVAQMSNEQLQHEIERVEALPGNEFRRAANGEFDGRRYRAALAAVTTGGTR